MIGRWLAAAAMLVIIAAQPAQAQYFGKNKVQYEKFDFQVLKTTHFDIYYYSEEAAVAQDVALMAERWYSRLSRILGHELNGRQPVILYASHPAFEQTNVIDGFIDESTGGVTEGVMRRVTLPLAATMADTDHVLGHELVHAFQFDMLGRNGEMLPLWFIEGMAEYLSLGSRDVQTAMWLRDAVIEKKVPPIKKLDDPKYFPYRFGQAFWAFVCGKYGDESIGRILNDIGVEGSNAAGDPYKAIETATEQKLDDLSTEWIASIEAMARPVIDRAQTPITSQTFGEKTGSSTLNVGPAISPDGTLIAFLSARDLLSIDLFVADVKTGKVLGKLTNTDTDPHFESLQFLASAGTWDPEGRQLAIAAVRKGRPEIAIIDVEKKGTIAREIEFKQLGEIFQPAWSPDGKYIAFSAQVGGVTDLFVLDMDTNQTRRLTNDKFADLQPAWSPDGKQLAFVTDRFKSDLATLSFKGYDVATAQMDTGAIAKMDVPLEGDIKNPQFSADGTALFFLSNHGGRQNAFRMDFDTRKIVMITNLPTAVAGVTPLSPALSVSAKGDVAIVTIFRDGGYEISILPSITSTTPPEPDGTDAAQLPPAQRVPSLVSQLLDRPASGLPEQKPTEKEPYSPGLHLVSIGQQVGVATTSTFGTYAAGGISFLFSDTLGNHVLGTGFGINGGTRDISVGVNYFNRASRWNWGLFAERIPLLSGTATQAVATQNGNPVIVEQVDLFRQTYNQVGGTVAFPFDRAVRAEFGAAVQRISFTHEVQTTLIDPFTGFVIDESQVDLPELGTLNLFESSAAIVRDTASFGATSPIRGKRDRVEVAPTFGDIDFVNITADLRRYVMPVKPLTFAGRLLHMGRYGSGSEDPRLVPLFLGYPTLVRGYDANSIDSRECTLTFTGRCQEFDRLFGSRMLVLNGEIRAPLVGLFTGKLTYGAVPAEVFGFIDSGVAWTAATGPNHYDNWVTSVGAGVRVNVFGFAITEFNLVRPLDRPLQGWMFVFNLRPGF